jgi:hypothetical protein
LQQSIAQVLRKVEGQNAGALLCRNFCGKLFCDGCDGTTKLRRLSCMNATARVCGATQEKQMNKSKLAGSAMIVVAALMGAAAFAQDAGLVPMQAKHGFDIVAMDADKDGKVTKAEADAFHAAKVKAADTNADGKLSAEELAAMQAAMMQARMADRAAAMVTKLDTDKDGFLSEAELAAAPMRGKMFDKMDADGDGAVTQAEVDAMQDMRGKGHGKGHGKHGGHGKGGHDMGDMMDGADQGN